MMNNLVRQPIALIIVFLLFFISVVINVIILDILILRAPEKAVVVQSLQSGNVCPASCVAKIDETVSTALKSKAQETTEQKEDLSSSSSGVKEYFVSFGSGTNATEDWTDVVGLASYIDSTKYPSIKTIVFEASVYTPTGNQIAYVRLFNVTDKHPVWFSDVSLEGGATKLLVSKPITLDTGNKLYQVQMKTSLKFQAILNQSRVHITLY